MEVLRSMLLAVPHGFSTRGGGVSPPPFDSLNMGTGRGDDPVLVAENRRRFLAQVFGPGEHRLALLKQAHSARAVVAKAGERLQADALVTNEPELILAVTVADCFPIILHDPDRPLLATAHAGWRGTLSGIVEATLTLMCQQFGADPARLQVAIGPGIGACCYEVGPEVAEAFQAAGKADGALHPGRGDRFLLDLAAIHHRVLEESGVSPAQVDQLPYCTSCRADWFFSHRRDQGRTGHMWAVAALPGG
ncbi:MAG: peptidoglycan editing factor PgeF [Deinococcus sp.]|nr:peptidoglycan editing factor PgeF [Deinococcus sp.]